MDLNNGTVTPGTDTSTVELNGDLNNTSTHMSEDDALSFLASNGNNETTPTDVIVDNLEGNNQAPEENNQVDLSGVDLSDFGIPNTPEENTTPNIEENIAPVVAEVNSNPEPTQMEEVLNKLNQLQTPGENKPAQMTAEEEAGVKELFNRFEQLGLIPKGMSEEDRTLMDSMKEMKETQDAQVAETARVEEFNTQVSAIETFSKSLETSIPGYDSKFMAQVITQINTANPAKGKEILENPTMLLDVWAKIGAKAQPQQQQTNVINGGGQRNNNDADLTNKVFSGKATEVEEGMLLAQL
jgi:hypothetical protein